MVLFTQGSALVVTTALAVVIARTLGPAEYGIFAAFLGIGMTLSRFIDAGLATWLLREFSRRSSTVHEDRSRRTEDGSLLSAAMVAQSILFIVGTAAAVGVVLVIGIGGGLLATCVGLIAYTSFATAAGGIETIFRARRRYRVIVWTTILEKLALLCGVLLAASMEASIVPIVAVYALVGGAKVLAVAVIAERTGYVAFQWVPPRRALALLRRSGPLALTSIATSLRRLDVTLVSAFSPAAGGLYGVADRIVTATYIVPNSAASALFPVLGNHGDQFGASRRASLALAAAGLVVAVVGVVTAEPLIALLFGSEFSGAVPVLQLLFIATPAMYLSGPVTTGLVTAGRYRDIYLITVPAMVGGLLLIPLGYLAFGIEGAALAVLLRASSMAIGLWWRLHATRARAPLPAA